MKKPLPPLGFIPIPLLILAFALSVGVIFLKVPVKTVSENSEAPIPSPTASVEISSTPTATAVPTATPTVTPTATATPAPTAALATTPPVSGYGKVSVTTDVGVFTVSLGSADIASTRVIVDTASASDCSSNCPVLSLGEYAARNNAYAGINGTYFCPRDYASCAGKENTFDFLVMNKNKTYINSDKNVYSTNPGVIFGDGYVRFVGAIQEWGRDTGPNGVLSNYPLLVSGGNVSFGGNSDPKMGSKGARSFVANKGNLVYIGVVHNATVAESARVLKALGMDNALNLDNGGSTALWWGGYKVGPGRGLPNVILFVLK
ncbi:hypothetical protein A2V61_00105 [Candidatus Woesebacteria bacterium RBG_19FT_COMBO_47_8]|uniref:Phosphodiester glycosidase domain-containing protein n=1 Tax=Candidatus Woesebacteria bacterium RBG_13_46_13 TaxID=1802479 RepID=A0A1F7X3L8_9BACT|nr:MAG: hypothetical protein A2Y68_03670 [Candidatus Woesebacteria bacterium RBG_13_46_13]OGM17860.1 MAG: hypothetical protein A2V61_00105 [Candidatus Woesebacteria bacterium RBG_19FT_COMBO_47_8]HJX59209.1 phosphodiester glycosidase family protein [Patescibacteria group bacterium]